jgi:CO/xanthine dehydrogenase FAD-binding subunit
MKFARPQEINSAVAFLRENSDAVILAGGTDIMPLLKRGRLETTALLDISAIEGLRGIELFDTGIRIGAATTIAGIVESGIIASRFPLLREIGLAMGSNQIRNMATIGGNMANASPAGDLIPGAIVLKADMELAGPEGQRIVSSSDFFIDYRRTALLPGEMIRSLFFPFVPEGYEHFYMKVGQRGSLSLSRLSLASLFRIEGGRIADMRMSGCSVQPFIRRFSATEAVMMDNPTSERIRAALAQDIAPIDDLRATAAYRMKVLENIICHRWHGLIH